MKVSDDLVGFTLSELNDIAEILRLERIQENGIAIMSGGKIIAKSKTFDENKHYQKKAIKLGNETLVLLY